mgnify:CR=1 FL=1
MSTHRSALILVFLMLFSVIPLSISPNINSSEEFLEANNLSETSEATQWMSGYECPDDGRCSQTKAIGTLHNIWLEDMMGPNSVTSFTATSAGAMTSAVDASVHSSGNAELIENYTHVRPFIMEFNKDLFETHDVVSMSTWELQKTRVIMMLDWNGTPPWLDNKTNTLVDEFTDLLNPAFLEVRRVAEADGVDEADFETRLDAIFDSDAYKDASTDAQDMMLAFHATYYASEYYWDNTEDTTGRAGGNFWKKVADACAIIGGYLTDGVSGGLVAAGSAAGSFQNDPAEQEPGIGGGFSGNPTVCPNDVWGDCINDRLWEIPYEGPFGSTGPSIDIGTTHNIWLEDMMGPNSVTSFTATSAGAMTSAVDASVHSSGNAELIENYTHVRPFIMEFNKDLFETHDVVSMSTWELQKTRVIMMLDWNGTPPWLDNKTNTLVDEFTDLLNPAFLEVRRVAEADGVDEADFETRLDAIFDSDAYKDASTDAQDMMLAFHATYYASEYYWDNTEDTTGRAGGNFWKKLGDAVGIVASAALGYVTGGPAGAISQGVTTAGAVAGSFQNDEAGQEPGIGGGFSGDTTVCAEDWRSCIIERVDTNGQPLLEQKNGTEDPTRNEESEKTSEESDSALPGFSAIMMISVLFAAAIVASRKD